MDNAMDKVFWLFTTSTEWGQNSNTSFQECLVSENKHLKAELDMFKKESKINQELIIEMVKLKKK